MAQPKALLDRDTLSVILRAAPALAARARDYLAEQRAFALSIITRYELLRGLKAKDATALAASRPEQGSMPTGRRRHLHRNGAPQVVAARNSVRPAFLLTGAHPRGMRDRSRLGAGACFQVLFGNRVPRCRERAACSDFPMKAPITAPER